MNEAPKDGKLWVMYGCLLAHQTQLGGVTPEDAKKSLDYGLKISPPHYHTYDILGTAYKVAGFYEESLEMFEKADELQPGCISQGEVTEVKNRLKRKQAGEDPMGAFDEKAKQAWKTKEAGDLSKALKLAREATKDSPNEFYPWYVLGDICSFTGEFKEGVKACEKALALESHHADIWLTLGNNYRNLGENVKALACFTKALSLDHQANHVWANMGAIYYEMGTMPLAASALSIAMQRYPQQQVAEMLQNLMTQRVPRVDPTIMLQEVFKGDPLIDPSLKGELKVAKSELRALHIGDLTVRDLGQFIEIQEDKESLHHYYAKQFEAAFDFEKAQSDKGYLRTIVINPNSIIKPSEEIPQITSKEAAQILQKQIKQSSGQGWPFPRKVKMIYLGDIPKNNE